MKEMTTRDLTQPLTLLLPQKQEDGEGGWREVWRKGPDLWASLWPLVTIDAFQAKDEGGAMASQKGYLKPLPPPRYRVVIRAGIELPLRAAFLWHLRQKSKRLLMTSAPTLMQYNRFVCLTVREDLDA